MEKEQEKRKVIKKLKFKEWNMFIIRVDEEYKSCRHESYNNNNNHGFLILHASTHSLTHIHNHIIDDIFHR